MGSSSYHQLFQKNTPANFWLLEEALPEDVWRDAATQAMGYLPPQLRIRPYDSLDELYGAILGEEMFGARRYQLGAVKSLYYRIARPFLSQSARHLVKRLRRPTVAEDKLLKWPIEDRFVRFQFETLRHALSIVDRQHVRFVGLWPDHFRFACVLTHDVEGRRGYEFVPQLMALEEKHGLRSSFNFIPKGYAVEPSFLGEMRERGFEVGVHGLKHDGKLFSSPRVFQKRALQINRYLQDWNAVGYRSPMTHRNPEWMQSLEIEYDLSFFDTDPFEPMAGGTMSIWPFFLGRFVELPYTLMQDHTYLEVFGYRTAAGWLEKLEFVREHFGMALLNSHPDYLLSDASLQVYSDFLAKIRTYNDCWHALPASVARWWTERVDGVTLDEETHSQNHPVLWQVDSASMRLEHRPAFESGRVSLQQQ